MSDEVALVLSGGGASAAYFGAGVAQGLADVGLRPTVLSGTSAGGLNAGLLAAGLSPQQLVELWINVQGHDVYKPRLDLWRLLRPAGLVRLPTSDLMGYALDSVGWTWLLDTAPARKTLIAAIGGERLRIEEGVRVVVAAVEECSGEVVHFTNSAPEGSGFHEVPLTVDHLMAGAAAPILFPPVHIDGRTYVDAGMVANTPLQPALAYEPRTVVVVTSSCGRQSTTPASLGDALGLAFENVARFAVLRDYEHTKQLGELGPGEAPRLVLIEPGDEFEVSGFARFDPDVARTVVAHGRARARAALATVTSGG
ncbi:patatin-like phospholipase family protein [Kutzneria buriramensis]|uniref:NTE family protein n=1 Tax=Kutzneria buriramensis TaxID=1045776 RepID=A0A3E0I0G4_9PSEU|nr:patatin-like phospholipase family protein [Kutzneria buriramensis]REH52208.1 NTE family protein [Kutzneria buriramensis]